MHSANVERVASQGAARSCVGRARITPTRAEADIDHEGQPGHATLTSLESIIQSYGLLAVFVGTILEGETILVLAGLAAHRGYLPMPSVIVAGFLGSFVGDQLFFLLGRWRGDAILARRPGWAASVARARSFLGRYDAAFILSFRFLYGLRTVSPFVIGMSGVGAPRFLLFNAIGAAIWAVGISYLGYAVGHGAELMLDRTKEIEGWLFAGVSLAGATVWLFYFLRRRRDST
jgi:membrane protein DedA with SNARE-associated domain